MKIACIGGGPAGLYLGILVKRVAPEHDVVVYERNRPADTFGFGVVFSDATLGHLAAADPETHVQITDRFARWDDIEVHVGGSVLRSTGHGFCGIERKQLLQILQTRAAALGVRVQYEHEIKSLAEVQGADVVVACDGVASWVRESLRAELQPNVDVRPNKFVWLGCTVPYEAFTFLFKQTQHGMFRVHAYRYHEQGSTFIVECPHETWRATGFDHATEDQTVQILEGIFAAELAGHRLVKNRSIWRNFPTVRCGKWHTGNVVLVGDAAHTAHFSIGSGTKLAMEDSIALRDELLATTDVPAALDAYERRRRPEVEALQAAAQASLEWFEGTERYVKMTPVQFTYSLMTRSLRVSHASMVKRDPELARGAVVTLGGTPGDAPTRLPFKTPEHQVRSRFIAAPLAAWTSSADDLFVALGAAASEGAGIVATPPLRSEMLESDDAAVAWRKVIDYVHGKDALIAARVVMPSERALERLMFAGFDLIVFDPDGDEKAIELLPSQIAAARAHAPSAWLAAVVDDRRTARAAVVGHAAQLVRAGASLLWVTSIPADALVGDGNARLPAAPLADRLRNELDVATCVEADDASLSDLDAAIAAGRADLVVVTQMPNASGR